MTDSRREIHEEIDRMPDDEVVGLKKLLKTYPTPLDAALRNTPPAEEPLTEEEMRLIEEGEEWLKHNKGIPHEEVFGLHGLGQSADNKTNI